MKVEEEEMACLPESMSNQSYIPLYISFLSFSAPIPFDVEWLTMGVQGL